MLRLYDGNNYYRRLVEADPTGQAPRRVLREMQGVCIWVWDGVGGNDRRRAIYPDYKMQRKTAKSEIFDAIQFMRKVLFHTDAIQIKVPGWEADDVIATLAKLYRQCEIWSNDWDFVQLTAEYPHVYCGAKLKTEVPAKFIRTYKTVVGDPSDNIKGIKGFGDKAWAESNHEEIRKCLIELVEGASSINLDWVPIKCQTWVVENIQLLRDFWEITGFYDVPLEEINAHTVVGDGNQTKADAMLREFFH